MSYRVRTNTPFIKSDVDNKISLGLRFMLEDVHREANPNTPKDKGNLRADVIKQVLGTRGRIIWTKNYAIYQEKKQYKNYTTKGTGPRFAENAVHEIVVNKGQDYWRRVGL